MKEDLLAKLVLTILVYVHVNLILLVPNVISVIRATMDGHGQIAKVSIFYSWNINLIINLICTILTMVSHFLSMSFLLSAWKFFRDKKVLVGRLEILFLRHCNDAISFTPQLEWVKKYTLSLEDFLIDIVKWICETTFKIGKRSPIIKKLPQRRLEPTILEVGIWCSFNWAI